MRPPGGKKTTKASFTSLQSQPYLFFLIVVNVNAMEKVSVCYVQEPTHWFSIHVALEKR